MIKREYSKLIQKDREHCEGCALVKEFCICELKKNLESKVNFILLTHSNELKKRTNTGVIIERNMKSTRVIEWMRKEPSKELLDIINSELDVYLLYPDIEEFQDKTFENLPNKDKEILSDKELLETSCIKIADDLSQGNEKYIIILDGTWQEAQKMFNRSEYLKNIKRLSLTPENLSEYKLRRKKDENHLCTVEAAIITLMKFGENENSDSLKSYFELFQTNYKYSQSN